MTYIVDPLLVPDSRPATGVQPGGATAPARRAPVAGGFGDVARIRILGQEHDEPALELLVQRREQQRQHRLGDARPRRQGGRERLQALEREQLPDE